MHRAATPAATALLLAIHLRERRFHRHASHERMAMFTIGRNDSISLLKNRDHADRDGLLAIIEMEKASNLLLRVELGAFVLEPSNADHLFQEIELMRAGQVWFVAHCSSLS